MSSPGFLPRFPLPSQVATPALSTVGNIATGNNSQTQSVVDAGCIPALDKLLDHPDKGVRGAWWGNRHTYSPVAHHVCHNHHQIKKEACWVVSNIAAGSRPQLQALLDSGIMPRVVNMIVGSRACASCC